MREEAEQMEVWPQMKLGNALIEQRFRFQFGESEIVREIDGDLGFWRCGRENEIAKAGVINIW